MKTILLLSLFCVGVFTQSEEKESYGNQGPPILGGAKKKSKFADLGPTIYEENEVQILVDADWDENMLSYDIYLVLFYQKDCEETAKFIKEFEAAADELIVTKPFTPLAKVDCSEGNIKTTGICSKIQKSSLPIIKLYRNEEFVMVYSGQRDRKSIINFIGSINAEGSKVIENPKDLKNLLHNSTDKFFVSFASKIYKRLHGAYQTIAEELMPYGVQFYFLEKPRKSKYYPGMDGQIVMYRPDAVKMKMENTTSQFGGKGRTESDLSRWIRKSYLSPVGQRNIMNSVLYKHAILVVVYANTKTGTEQSIQYIKNRAAWVAQKRMFTDNDDIDEEKEEKKSCDEEIEEVNDDQKFCKFNPEDHIQRNDKLKEKSSNFHMGISDKQDFRKELETCGFDTVRIDSEEVLVCSFRDDGNRYPMLESFSKDNLDTFVQQVLENSVEPYIHAGKLDDTPRFEFAKQLTAYDLVNHMKKGNDKVILFIGKTEIDKSGDAELLNAFIAASKDLKDDKDVEFVYMDLTDNEIAPNLTEEFSVDHQTSIYLVAGHVTRFRPVVGQENLAKVLIKFIGQRWMEG